MIVRWKEKTSGFSLRNQWIDIIEKLKPSITDSDPLTEEKVRYAFSSIVKLAIENPLPHSEKKERVSFNAAKGTCTTKVPKGAILMLGDQFYNKDGKCIKAVDRAGGWDYIIDIQVTPKPIGKWILYSIPPELV